MDVLKIGSVELYKADAEKLYTSGKKYLVTYSAIYQINFSQAQNTYYGSVLIRPEKKTDHYTKRGRFFAYDAASVNWLLGYKLLNE